MTTTPCVGSSSVIVQDLTTLLIKQCEDKIFRVWLRDDLGDPAPLAGYLAYFEIRKTPTSNVVLLSLEIGSGIEIVDDKFVITITTEQSCELPVCPLSGGMVVTTPPPESLDQRLFRAAITVDPTPVRSHV